MINVIFAGQLRSPSGYSKAFRDYLLALERAGIDNSEINLKVYDVKLDEEGFEDSRVKHLIDKYEISDKQIDEYVKKNKNNYILMAYIPTCMYERPSLKNQITKFRLGCGYHINMTLWETDKMPDDWIELSKELKIDSLIANCYWNKEIFEKDYELPCEYVPCVVEPLSTKNQNSLNLADGDVFKILSVSTFVHRKGFDILIRAFVSEFEGQEDVALFIKTYFCSFSDQFKQKIKDEVTAMKNSVIFGSFTKGFRRPTKKINLLLDKYTHEEMGAIYNSVDLFALFSRGEGFGLPYTEALVNGIPVACADKGGHLDFCLPQFTFFAESRYDTCSDDCWYTADMRQIETSVDSARKTLREAYNLWKFNRTEYDNKKKLAKDFFSDKNSEFNYENVGKKLIKIFKSVKLKENGEKR